MATRKQKHAAALAKREEFMDELRKSGLEAQKTDHEERAKNLSESSDKNNSGPDSSKSKVKSPQRPKTIVQGSIS